MNQSERPIRGNSSIRKPSTPRLAAPVAPGRGLRPRGDTSRLRPVSPSPAKQSRGSQKMKLALISCMPVMILVVIVILVLKPAPQTVKEVTDCPDCHIKVSLPEDREKQIIFKCTNGHEFIIDNQKALKEARELFRLGNKLFQEAMEMVPPNQQRLREAQDKYLDKAMKFYELLTKNNEPVGNEIYRLDNILKEIRSRRTKDNY